MQPLNPHRTGATITSVIASPRTRGKGGSYPSAPLILPPGSKMCCEAIAQSSTSVWRDVPFPPTRWLSVLRMQKEQRGTQCKLENPGGGSVSVFHSTHPPAPRGHYGGLPARWNWGSGHVAVVVVVCPRRFLVSPFGGGKSLSAVIVDSCLSRCFHVRSHVICGEPSPSSDVSRPRHDITSNGPHPPDLPVPVPDPICRKPVESRMGCQDTRHWLHCWSPVSTVPLDSFSTPPLPRDDDGSIAGIHLIHLH